MVRIKVCLKRLDRYRWAVFGPRDNQISEPFKGSKADALKWAKKWISSWYTWDIVVEDKDEKD